MMANEFYKNKVEEDKAQLAADEAALAATPEPEPAPPQELAQATTEEVAVTPAEPASVVAPEEAVAPTPGPLAYALGAVAAADAASQLIYDAASADIAFKANMEAADALFAIGEDGGPFYLRAQQHKAVGLFKGV
jgi:hypothetical protein